MASIPLSGEGMADAQGSGACSVRQRPPASAGVPRCWHRTQPAHTRKSDSRRGAARTGSLSSWPRVLFWHCKGRADPAHARRGRDSLALPASPHAAPSPVARQPRTDHSRTCHGSIRQSRDTRVVPGSRLAALKTQRGSFINAALGAPHQPRPARPSSAGLPAAEKYGTVTRLPPLWHRKRRWPVPHPPGPRRVGPLLLYGRPASVSSQPLDLGLQTLVTLPFFLFFPCQLFSSCSLGDPFLAPTAARMFSSDVPSRAEKRDDYLAAMPRAGRCLAQSWPSQPIPHAQPPSRLAVARSVVAKRCRATGLHRGDQRPIAGTVKRDAVRANICR